MPCIARKCLTKFLKRRVIIKLMNTVKIIPTTKVQFELAINALTQWRNEAKEVLLDDKENISFAFVMNPATSRVKDTDVVGKK